MLHAETANGWAAGLWITVAISVIAFAASIGLGAFIAVADREFRPLGWGIFWAVVIPAAAWGIFTMFAWPPFSMRYHTYYPTTITVASTSSRFIGDGNSVSQRIALTDAAGHIYGCDDTRCTTLKKGDTVTLMCVLEWEGNGVPGYVCNWGKLGTNG